MARNIRLEYNGETAYTPSTDELVQSRNAAGVQQPLGDTMGKLSELKTDDKSSFVAAINEVKTQSPALDFTLNDKGELIVKIN